MAWDFETEPEFQEKLDWIEEIVQNDVEPLIYAGVHPSDVTNPIYEKLVRPLQRQVKDQGLWACHLGPDLGGQGYGQVKLGLINEILGGYPFAPSVFGCQAPDTGNAEIIAHFGTDEQKTRYLEPLLDNRIVSSFSMTEPQGGSDPTNFVTTARLDGGEWVIDGEKWFSTNARWAEFLVVMAVTDPDAEKRHHRTSMFLVPADTPGIEIVRSLGVGTSDEGSEGYIRYNDVRVPEDHLLGERGKAFMISQVRLGGGRIHHAMRTVGQCRRALDQMCQRAVSRRTRDGTLADKQLVQADIADSYIQLQQFRLQVLHAAWLIDKHKDYRKVRKDIAAVKVAMPKVYHDIVSRAMHLHGSLGVSNEMGFARQLIGAYVMGIADGPTEVHKMTVAKQLLREYAPGNELFPDYTIPNRKAAARERYGDTVEIAQDADADEFAATGQLAEAGR